MILDLESWIKYHDSCLRLGLISVIRVGSATPPDCGLRRCSCAPFSGVSIQIVVLVLSSLLPAP